MSRKMSLGRPWKRGGRIVLWAILFGVGAPLLADPESGRKSATGIDVSHHSGAVDWAAVKVGGHAFAYAKATEGIDLVDPRFADHWEGMLAAGLVRGAYHFYVTEDDPAEQAHFFLETVHHQAGDLIPVVDIEVLGHGTQPGLADRLLRFLAIVEGEVGVAPVLYTSVNFATAQLDDRLARYPLWIAEYEVERPRLPEGWSSWALWQWAEDQEIEGVEKGADVSRLNPSGTLQELRIPKLDRSEPAGEEH